MPNPKIFLVPAVICLVLLAITGSLLFAWLGGFFFLLVGVIRLDNSATFKRIMKLCASICAKWIQLAWKRAHVTWTKVFLLSALICLVALAVSGNSLFIVAGVVFLLIAMPYALNDNERFKRTVLSPFGLQTMVLLEAGCLAIMAVSVARIASNMQEIQRLIDEAQSIETVERLYQQLREAGSLFSVFVGLPMMVISTIAYILKTHKENPFVIELKASPLWKFQRAIPIMLFVANIGSLIAEWLW